MTGAARQDALKPWHDAPLHACADGARGPIAPVAEHPASGDPGAMRCCACGERWHEADTRVVVHAWWSAGAHEGKEAAR